MKRQKEIDARGRPVATSASGGRPLSSPHVKANAICAVVDFWYTPLHAMVNSQLIRVLSEQATLDVYDWDGAYAGLCAGNIRGIRLKAIKAKTTSALSARLVILLNTLIAALSLRRRYDKVFVFGYDLLTFPLARLLLGFQGEVVVVHHMQVDELSNPVKRRVFNLFKNSVRHIVLADFIKRHLVVDRGVPAERIVVLQHPGYRYERASVGAGGSPAVVGLSNSNSDRFIEGLVGLESRESRLARHGVRMILKSKTIEFDNGWLRVFRGNLPREEYDSLFREAAAVVVLLDASFRYRISGVMIDALSYGKTVIGTDVPSFREYSAKYGGVCRVAPEPADAIEQAILVCGDQAASGDFAAFASDSSVEALSDASRKLWLW